MTRITGTLYDGLCTFMVISRSVRLGMRDVSDKRCRGNQNSNFLFHTFFQKSCHLRNNVEKYGRAR